MAFLIYIIYILHCPFKHTYNEKLLLQGLSASYVDIYEYEEHSLS